MAAKEEGPAATSAVEAAGRATFVHSDEEWDLVQQLRKRTGDVEASEYWKSPQCLHRFICARKKDLDAAEAQYREALTWRKV